MANIVQQQQGQSKTKTYQKKYCKQCTIIWHADDLKISHAEKNIVEDIIRLLNEKFGKESPLTTSRGRLLKYLDMMLDYTTKGKVKISMYEYVGKYSRNNHLT